MMLMEKVSDIFSTPLAKQMLRCREELVRQAEIKFYSRSPYLAEDLVQETLIKAIKNQHYFISGKNLMAWLATIMFREFVTLNRKEKRMKFVENDVIDYEYLLGCTDPEEEVKHYDLPDIYAMFHILNPTEQQYFYMRLKGMKYQEIAEQVDSSEGAVKIHVFRAKNKLKNHFESKQAA